ncbi:MAG: hypothetical protein IJK93_05125 [Muribaculaceae bacterium]|nr:hypothetical protein [Muribaculaceae bacterium]
MDNALEYILTHYQLPKYKDFSCRAVLKALVNTLNYAELKELQGKLKRGTSSSNIGNELYNEIEKVLNTNQPQKNEPISYLLKQYTDKRSGKVAISRPKLQDRYDKQDFHSQRKILKAFLAGSKRDRVWAYKKLKCNWDAFFADDIKALWEKYHDKDCERVVIRFLPTDYIIENLPLLDSDENYSWLCTRLINHPQFQFDKKRFSKCDHIYWGPDDVEYLYILAISKSGMEKGEATRILYKRLITQLINHKEIPESYTEIGDNSTMWRGMELVRRVDGLVPTTKWFKVVRRVLWCMGKLGLTEELIAFEEWDKRVQYWFDRRIREEEYWLCYSAQEYYSLFHTIVMESIPDRFRYLINEELESRKKRIELMRKPNFDSFIDEFNLEIIDNSDSNKELPF